MKYIWIFLVLVMVTATGCINNEQAVQGIFSEQTIWYQNDSHVFFYDCKIGDEYLYIRENEMPEWELGRAYKVAYRNSRGDKYFNEILNWEEVFIQSEPTSPVHKVTIEEVTPQ